MDRDAEAWIKSLPEIKNRCRNCTDERELGHIRCRYHLDQMNGYMKRRFEQRTKAGLCYICGKVKPLKGMKWCHDCSIICLTRGRSARRRNKNRARKV